MANQGLGSGESVSQKRMAGGSQQLGSYLINSSEAVTWGQYEYLVVNADCVISVLTTDKNRNLLLGNNDPDGSGGINIDGITLSKGMFIYSPDYELIRDVTIDSGSVMAYG